MVLYISISMGRETERETKRKNGHEHLDCLISEGERQRGSVMNIYIYSLIGWLPSWCWLNHSFATGWLCQDQRGQGSICHRPRFSTGSEGPGLCQWCRQSSHGHRQQAGEVGHHTEWEEVWVCVSTVFDGSCMMVQWNLWWRVAGEEIIWT